MRFPPLFDLMNHMFWSFAVVLAYGAITAGAIWFGNGSKMKHDPQQVLDLFAVSPVVGTGVFKLRGKFMVERKCLSATMKVDVWQKDMPVIGYMAKSLDCPAPLFTACIPIYNSAMRKDLVGTIPRQYVKCLTRWRALLFTPAEAYLSVGAR